MWKKSADGYGSSWIARNEYQSNEPRQQGAIGMVFHGAPDRDHNCDLLIFPIGFWGEQVPEQKSFAF